MASVLFMLLTLGFEVSADHVAAPKLPIFFHVDGFVAVASDPSCEGVQLRFKGLYLQSCSLGGPETVHNLCIGSECENGMSLQLSCREIFLRRVCE